MSEVQKRDRAPLLDRLEAYAASGMVVAMSAEDLRGLCSLARQSVKLNEQLRESTSALKLMLDMRQDDKAEIARLRAVQTPAKRPIDRGAILQGAVLAALVLSFCVGVLAAYTIAGPR